MKLLQFLQQGTNTPNRVVFFAGTCPFQTEILLKSLVRAKSPNSVKLGHQRLDLSETQLQEVLSLLKNRSLYASESLYFVEGLQLLSDPELQNLIAATENPADPRFHFLIRLPKSFKGNIPSQGTVIQEEFDPFDKREYFKIKCLTDLVVHLMKEARLPLNAKLTQTLATRCFSNPLEIFSKIHTLELFLSEDRKTFEVNDVLPLFPREKHPPFRLLDAIGLRNAKRILEELPVIERSLDTHPLPLLAAVKKHLGKLFNLASWIEQGDRLTLINLADRFFKERSFQQKRNTAEKIRQYFREKLSPTELKQFEVLAKKDLPLAKLIYQLRFSEKDGLEDALMQANQIQLLFQSSNLPQYHLLLSFFLVCSREYSRKEKRNSR